jgi:hypothetical protein
MYYGNNGIKNTKNKINSPSLHSEKKVIKHVALDLMPE